MLDGKRKVSLFATLVFLMLAMATTAMAAIADYPQLTPYGDTQYSVTVSTNDDSIIDLQVRPISDDYTQLGAFTFEEAQAIEWNAALLSDSDMIFISPIDPVAIEGGYAAAAQVYVFAGAAPGPNSVYAKNSLGNKISFTVVVNGAAAPVSNISAKYYVVDANGTEQEMAVVNNMTVAANAHYSEILYPNVCDAIAQSQISGSGLNKRIASYSITTPSYWTNLALYSIKFMIDDTETQTYQMNGNNSWLYRVYRNNTLVDVSADLGVEQFELQNGDVVVWKYGNYYDVTFADTLS